MYRIGVHNSTNGGLKNLINEIRALKTNTTQFFIHSPRMWRFKKLSDDEIKEFIEFKTLNDINPVVIHSSYLITPLSEKREVVEKTEMLLRFELDVAERIADYYVMHIRENKNIDLNENIRKFCLFFKDFSYKRVKILLENSASGITSDLKSLFKFYDTVKANKLFAGFCIDTAHIFEAGYDIRKKDGVVNILKEIKKPDLIKLIHLNDSKTYLSSHIDRHSDIDKGEIKMDGFKNFFSFDEFRNKPVILETPKKTLNDDEKNLKKAREILEVFF